LDREKFDLFGLSVDAYNTAIIPSHMKVKEFPLMSRFTSCNIAAIFFMVVLSGVFVYAAGEGQDDLDKATEAKLAAETVADLAGVIDLAESALKKGLDKSNTDFAKELLASTLIQRGSITASAIFKSMLPDPKWAKYRQEALADFEKAVVLDPKQSQAFLFIAQLNLLPDGDLKRARETVDKAIEINDDDPLMRAKVFVLRASMQETPEKKLADLDEAIRLAPGNTVTLRVRGLLLADLGKLDASLEDFEKAIELDPDDATTYEAKAIVLARLKKYDESLAAFEEAKHLNPDSIDPLVRSAYVHSQQEKPEAAMEDLNQALAMDPNNVAVLLLRAGLYQQQGEKDKALADADRAVQLKPDFPIALRTHALLLADNEKYEEATQELEKLHKLNPKDALTLMQLSILYGLQKQYPKAIENYTAWLEEQPDEWRALRGRGDAYLSMGKQAEAIADYEGALKLESDDHGILNNLAWVLATSPDEKLRDGKRAIDLATEACESTEYKLSHILSTLAAAYAETGDFKTAIQWSSKSVEIAEEEQKDALKKELESYKAGKPWRELLPEDEPEKKP